MRVVSLIDRLLHARRGEMPREARLLAAQGALTPRAYEQLAILVLLVDDRDKAVHTAAERTLGRIPVEALQTYLARSDVPLGMRDRCRHRCHLGRAGRHGNSDGEHRSPTRNRAKTDWQAKHARHPVDDRQAETETAICCATGRGRVQADEFLEDEGVLVFADARAIVPDLDAQARANMATTDQDTRHPAVCAAVTQCIGDEILQDSAQ